MKELFAGAWQIMSLELTVLDYTFKLWHPMAYLLICSLMFRIITGGGNKND